jgi:hypothetical protein
MAGQDIREVSGNLVDRIIVVAKATIHESTRSDTKAHPVRNHVPVNFGLALLVFL